MSSFYSVIWPSVITLLLIGFPVRAIVGDGGEVLTSSSSQCRVVAAKVALENQNTVVNTTFRRLVGTWLSEGCEIRPGPEYVLRSYTFKSDGTYRVIQHRYWDDSCSSPKLSLVSHGLIRLKRNAVFIPGSATGYIKAVNTSIIPHDAKAAKELDALVSRECPGNYYAGPTPEMPKHVYQQWRAWRRHEEHLVYESNEYLSNKNPHNFPYSGQNAISAQKAPQSFGDVTCLGSLKWAFNELKLLQVQLRSILGNMDSFTHARYELLLGDIHSRLEQREYYTPTAFQTPLLKYLKGGSEQVAINGKNVTVKNACNICVTLFSNDKSPPHLLKKPHLPPYLWGEWISQRCEIRPMGLYLTRKFSFTEDLWIGEHTFYEDPSCTVPKFHVTAKGQFKFTIASTTLEGGTNLDFIVERATLALYNKRMVHEMRLFGACGREPWQLGVPQELSATYGCLKLGLVIPSVQYEVVKVEMSYEGSCLLYLGQSDTDNIPRISHHRPTSFAEPLMKCGDVEKYSFVFNDNDNNSASELTYFSHYLLCSLVLLVLV